MSSSDKNIWKVKGATLSDKSAMEEYGLTQAEIASAINNGKFQYLVSYAYENPYFKLIRTEIEQYIIEKYGKKHLEKHTLKNELKKVNKNLRTLKSQVKKLEIRKEPTFPTQNLILILFYIKINYNIYVIDFQFKYL